MAAQLPVFVFPNQLTFYSSDPQSHRQIMTIYNPYDFPVSYEILSTAPAHYTVQEPQGTLRPRCCVDIAIRVIELHHHRRAAGGSSGEEKFRVVLTSSSSSKRRTAGQQQQQQGYRDVTSVVYDHKPPADSSSSGPSAGSPPLGGGHFGAFVGAGAGGSSSRTSSVRGGGGGGETGTGHQYPLPSAGRSGGRRPVWLLVIIGALCILCLSAPITRRSADDQGQGQSAGAGGAGGGWIAPYYPHWFHLGVTHQLVAAYVLGLITVALLQQD